MREGSSGVSSTRADETGATVVMYALDGWNGLHVFETPRRTNAAFFGPVAVEGNPEIGKSHRLTKRLGFVRHRAGDVVVGLRGRNP